MKSMSSTDTPLQTLRMLKDKQKSEQSAYVVLSGNKGFTGFVQTLQFICSCTLVRFFLDI